MRITIEHLLKAETDQVLAAYKMLQYGVECDSVDAVDYLLDT